MHALLLGLELMNAAKLLQASRDMDKRLRAEWRQAKLDYLTKPITFERGIPYFRRPLRSGRLGRVLATLCDWYTRRP